MVVDSLSGHSCFKTLDPDSCRALDRQCAWLKTPAGAWVAGEAGSDREVYFVLTGRLRVTPHWGRQDLVTSDLGAGSFFGELSALEGVPTFLCAFALEDSTLAKMPSHVFIATTFSHRPLGEAVIATLVLRNRALTRKVAEAAHGFEGALTAEGLRPGRPEQIRFDARASANPRRARRWS